MCAILRLRKDTSRLLLCEKSATDSTKIRPPSWFGALNSLQAARVNNAGMPGGFSGVDNKSDLGMALALETSVLASHPWRRRGQIIG